ncbi:GntR family transcriptional regulator [Streptomyces sp. YIM S03343]
MSGQQTGDEGGTREFERVATELLARIDRGDYPVGHLLPPQRDLAAEFGVSRVTVQRALKDLQGQGWITSRQGSGSRVVRRPPVRSTVPAATDVSRGVSLESLFDRAFEQADVSLDVFTLTSETLYGQIQAQALRIRRGSVAPRSISLRMVLPTGTTYLPYPRAIGDEADEADEADERLRARLNGITERHSASLESTLRALRAEGQVPSVDVQIRRAPLTPTFKLYVFNRREVLHGPYEVIVRKIELNSGEEVEALDVLGFGSTLTRHVTDEDEGSADSVFVCSMQSWFDSVWSLLAS